MRNQCVDLDLEYALRMISAGSATPEQAARMCGIPLATLQARVQEPAPAPTKEAKALAATADASDSGISTRAGHAKSSAGGRARNRATSDAANESAAPHVAAVVPASTVYSRTAKGVLAITPQTKKFPSTLKNVFFAVDNKATVGELLVRLDMNPAYIHHALRTLENDGYIETFRHESAEAQYGAVQSVADTDLDFTTPGALAKTPISPARRSVNAVREIPAPSEAVPESARVPVANKLTGLAPKTGVASARPPFNAKDAGQPLLRPVATAVKPPAAARNALPADFGQAQAPAQPESPLEAERRARKTAEATAEADRRAREEALQLLEEAVQALRDMKNASAEEQRHRAKADADALAQREALQSRLDEAEDALGKAERTSLQAQLQIGKERRAREDAEAEAQAERRARTDALQALEHAKQQAQESEAARRAAEVRLEEVQISLERAEDAGGAERERLARLEEQIEIERLAREQAEAALDTELRAHRAAAKALSDFKATMAEERARHEEQQARARAESQALRSALENELSDAKTERERAIEAAYRHAERHAQIEMEVESQRRAREDAEAKARAEQHGREEAAQALLEVKRALGLWKNS